MSYERNAEVMKIYVEDVVGEGRTDLLEQIAHVDIRDHAAVALHMRQGRDGWADHVDAFRRAFSELSVSLETVVAGDDKVVGIWTYEGVHSGPYYGISPTNRRISGSAASIFRTMDGKVTDYEAISDNRAILATIRSSG